MSNAALPRNGMLATTHDLEVMLPYTINLIGSRCLLLRVEGYLMLIKGWQYGRENYWYLLNTI